MQLLMKNGDCSIPIRQIIILININVKKKDNGKLNLYVFICIYKRTHASNSFLINFDKNLEN